MNETIKELYTESLTDTWNDFKDFFKQEKVKKADIEDYIDGLDANDTIDNLFFNQGYLQALRDVQQAIERSEIRQGRNEII